MINSRQAAKLVSGLAGLLVVLCWSSYIQGADPDKLTALQNQGYKIIVKTMAKGEFVGCEFNLPIKLQNGMVFVCLSDQRGRAYQPDVTILQDANGDTRVLIDGEEYRGTLTRE